MQSRLLQLPEGAKLPKIVSEITGISAADMAGAVDPVDALRDFRNATAGQPLAVAHYAQFEKPFLEAFLGELPFRLLCSYRVARRLFPDSPSRSIRGMLGFLDLPVAEVKRAAEHVEATRRVWSALLERLAAEGVLTLAELDAWMSAKPEAKGKAKVSYVYHLEKEKRLSLPRGPGIYRMLSREGKVLYVGKATSLRDRVNSYFRGKKGRDPRKLEMLTQVRDIRVTECGSPLEAALLETDEIKQWNPPYNVSLKTGERGLVFYTRDFSVSANEQAEGLVLGPFRPGAGLAQLLELKEAVEKGAFWGLYGELVEPGVLAEGMAIARAALGFRGESVREWLATGLRFAWVMRKAEAAAEAVDGPAEGIEGEELVEEAEVDETPLTPEEVAARIAGVLRGAAEEYLRSKQLTRLLNGEVSWDQGGETRRLKIAGGKLDGSGHEGPPWAGLTIADFDRMVVLRSELAKVKCRPGAETASKVES